VAHGEFSELDRAMMARALALAARGLYTTTPNPRVGCVIAQGERIVGEGWHARAGLAHAEANALGSAGDAARGATVYLTLEPCNHRGRTPPCAEALVAAGVPCAPVLSVPAALQHPHTAHRGMVVEMPGGYRGIASPIKLQRTPASYRFAPLAEGDSFLPRAANDD